MSTAPPLLKTLSAAEYHPPTGAGLDDDTVAQANAIIAEVRGGGWAAVRRLAERFGDRRPGEPLVLSRDDLRAAWNQLTESERGVLSRTCDRIRAFAQAQRDAVQPLATSVCGGRAGHRWVPIHRVGCYVPGGRYPLPSTALMTIATARVAGCDTVVAASPNPAPLIQGASYIAGADALLCVGGAGAIAALAYGLPNDSGRTTPFHVPCDLIVGPGNRWVTAAKKLVYGDVGIDMLAGPSELVIFADDSAHPGSVAADLIAQAEHDTDARPILVTVTPGLIAAVNEELATQLAGLPTAATALAALANGVALLATTAEEAYAVIERLAPEHLELHCRNAEGILDRFTRAGCVFLGYRSAEVFGDYGIGPNHTLPTGRTARFSSGLSVVTFMRTMTWLAIDDSPPESLITDTAQLARWERLEGHARAAERRRMDLTG